jgi:MarR family transcriptional regulator, organic hydroperoxide resistance regulator
MTTTTQSPLAVAARAEAISGLGASFKRVMVAVRRLRGRDTQRPGTPSFAQYQLLFALADGDGLSTGELAAAAELSPATVTQMLDALVEHGFVERSRSSHDRRIVTCSLTREGRSLIAGRRALLEQSWQEALTDFPTEQLELSAAVFDRIAAMFDEFDADAHE